MRRPQGEKRGYILVMVVVMLAIAGLALGHVSQQSLSLAVDAARRADEMQCRWGFYSIERSILPRRSELLQPPPDQNAPENTPPPSPLTKLDARIRLGEFFFELRLADESAKVNVNSLFQDRDMAKTQHAVQQLVHARRGRSRVSLRPNRRAAARVSHQEPFEMLDQVFAEPTKQEIGGIFRDMIVSSELLTCWGDGRLNVRVASKEALEQVCRLALDDKEAGEVVAARLQRPHLSPGELLASVKLADRKREETAALLTDRSNCYSLWIIASCKQRVWTQCFISEPAGQTSDRVLSFSW